MAKPQDIVVMLKLLTWPKNEAWTYHNLAKSIGISQSEVHGAIIRCQTTEMYDPLTRRPRRAALLEFLIHGLKYVFPEQPGKICKGIPTAHSAKPLNKIIVSPENGHFVWPHPSGKTKGHKIIPLYRTVPRISLKDQRLYELFALLDAIRTGNARERSIAVDELKKRIQEI